MLFADVIGLFNFLLIFLGLKSSGQGIRDDDMPVNTCVSHLFQCYLITCYTFNLDLNVAYLISLSIVDPNDSFEELLFLSLGLAASFL